MTAASGLPNLPAMPRLFAHAIGTFFGVGHIPVIPATWTSLAVAILFYLVSPLHELVPQLVFLAVFLVLGVPACGALEREYGEDPKQATADEVAGMVIGLLAIPMTALNVLVAFVLFRIFDVVKPPPARSFESFPGGWGIMADDVMAGIYTRLAMAVFLWLAPQVGL